MVLSLVYWALWRVLELVFLVLGPVGMLSEEEQCPEQPAWRSAER